MKIKFFGQPNELVKQRKKKLFSTEFVLKPLFRFDENGEYVTEDERLIEKLKRKFKYEPVEENPPPAPDLQPKKQVRPATKKPAKKKPVRKAGVKKNAPRSNKLAGKRGI